MVQIIKRIKDYILNSKHQKGRLIVIYNRTNLWLNIPTKIAMILMYFKMYQISWWYFIFIPLFLLWMLYDIMILYPEQTDFGQTSSQTFMELVEDVKEIKQILDEK